MLVITAAAILLTTGLNDNNNIGSNQAQAQDMIVPPSRILLIAIIDLVILNFVSSSFQDIDRFSSEFLVSPVTLTNSTNSGSSIPKDRLATNNI